MPEPTDVSEVVRTMLEAAGLTLKDEEIELFAAAYPLLRESADRLYIEELQHEEPALQFTPVPPARPQS